MDVPFLDFIAQRVALFDGGTGTEIYGRGVFLNRCYEQLNLDRPELVAEVHRSFVEAGGDAVETNTFAANRPKLEPHGLAERVREINRAGARIAREAVGAAAYVAGSIGPLGIRLEPWGPTTVDEAVELFREQAEGLAEGGVDLIVVETFSDIVEIQAAVRAVRAVTDVPLVAMMTVDEEGRTPEGVPPEWFARKLADTGADVVGVNCSVGPAPMLSVVEAMAQVCRRPLAAMPNAGIPREVDGRMLYLASPVYMGRYARRFARAGARIVGGCCGVTPDHVRAMREALGEAGPRRPAPRLSVPAPPGGPAAAGPHAKRSALAGKIAAGRFVLLFEADPPRGWSPERLLEDAVRLARAGADGLLVTDDPRAMARMSSLALARLVAERLRGEGSDTEPVLQYACRDRSLSGMQADLLGAHALGLRNVMLVTGQAPRPGEPSWVRGAIDVDAIGLTNVVNRLNHGVDLGDVPFDAPTAYFTGVLASIAAPDLDEEVRRFEWKVDAGAEFAVTTPVFDPADLERFLQRIAPVRVPVIAAVQPLRSARDAEYLAGEVPGVRVPAAIVERMASAEAAGAAASEGVAIAAEIARRIAPLVEGLLVAGPRALEPGVERIVAPLAGTEVAERRRFPGRPGIKGGADAGRFDRGS